MKLLELVLLPARSMRRAALSWAVALALIIVATVAFWPAFRGATIDQLINQLPSDLVQALGMENFGTPAGWLRGNLYELLVPLLAAIAGILLVNGATASDEDAGRLELLLTQPVRRSNVFLGRVIAAGLWLALIGLVILASQFVSDEVFGLSIESGLVIATIVLSMLLAAFHAGLAFCLAGLTGRPGLVVGVCLAVAIFGYIVSALLPISHELADLARLSPWNWALAADPLVNPTEPWRYLALALPAIVLVVLGTVAFTRRDVRAA
jgi:ABC-2 type transport system permease protein